MASSLTRFSWPLWGGGRRKQEKEPVSKDYSLKVERIHPYRKVRRKEEETRIEIDKQYDAVVVASDGDNDWCYLSGSESDESEWSIGWSEPFSSGFQTDDDDNDEVDSFAVLVPCYKHDCKEEVEGSNNVLLNAIKNLPNGFSSAGNNYMEQWLASIQKL